LRVQMEEAGALAILRKPFDAEALMRLVRTAIDARRLR
jgi:FixJ family two-component response regulator